MEPKKPRTLQERFGFQDHELATPIHDEIMLWLDSRIEDIVREYSPKEWEESLIDNANDIRKRIPMQDLPPRPPDKVARKVWEYPVMDRNFIVGFVDMFVSAVEPLVRPEDSDLVYIQEKAHLAPGITHGKWKTGYRTNSLDYERHYVFEVKPQIRSLGEVIRQMRMYEPFVATKGAYVHKPVALFVVCPDDRFRAPLESQGIHFVKYEP